MLQYMYSRHLCISHSPVYTPGHSAAYLTRGSLHSRSLARSFACCFLRATNKGVGHLRRASVIIQGLVAHPAKVHVTVVLGGPPVPALVEELSGHARVRLVYLPRVFASDSQTWKLVGEDGEEIDDAWKGRRRARLMAIYEETMPTVVMIEMFPFGRRRFHFELEPLLDRCYEDAEGGAEGGARRRPAIVCSVRDVLVTGKTAHHAWAAEKIWTYFDKVLVHGDEEVLGFGRTFECLDDIREFVVHTGTDWLGLTVRDSVWLSVYDVCVRLLLHLLMHLVVVMGCVSETPTWMVQCELRRGNTIGILEHVRATCGRFDLIRVCCCNV